MHSCHVPTYVEEVRKCFKEAYTEAHLQTNNKADWQKWYYDRATSTMQLMLGDVILMKLDTFQGKRKAKDRWSEVEYMVTCQVTNDVPVYKVGDDGRNVKVTHCNRLFLVAPIRDVAMSLGESESASYVGAAQSTLVELTPLKWKGETSESDVEGVLTWHLTSCVPLGWVDGVLWLLPSVVLRPTVCRLSSGEGTSSFRNEDIH